MVDIRLENKKYLLKFYYIGKKKYYGSQRQENYLSIEEILIKSLKQRNYFNDISNPNFEVASRTDRFVSARGAAFSFITAKEPILMELNTVLPKEIGIWAFTEVEKDFSARYDAILRHYKYICPQRLKYLINNYNINFDIIQKACKELEGQHDFINFSKTQKDNVKKTIRDMVSVSINIYNDYIVFDFKSKGFLRQQIRRMVKKILELGMGEFDFETFLELFDGTKRFSYQPADPRGLILWDIIYEPRYTFQEDLKSKERMNNYFFTQEQNFGLKEQLFHILRDKN